MVSHNQKSAATHVDGVAIVVRECGERTAEACVGLLHELFRDRPIYRVGTVPFGATLRLSLEKGLSSGCTWTLCIDADVLVLPDLLEWLDVSLVLPDDVFGTQALVFDKLMTAPRPAGNHLYRTRHLAQALTLVPEDKVLRPESHMIEAMVARGFRYVQSERMIGLHDFAQSYRDLYSKAHLHSHKHRYLLPLFRPLWQSLAQSDPDFRVALLALEATSTECTPPALSRSELADEAKQAIAILGLKEKPPLDAIPDRTTLLNWIASMAPKGKAHELSRQITSSIMRGLFPSYCKPQNSSLPIFIRTLYQPFKPVLKRLRRTLIAEQTLHHLEAIRRHELYVVTALLPPSGKLLEIGSGTGWQAQTLAQHGYAVSAVDLASSYYAENRVFPVLDYNGHTLPFDGESFDIIYSSNVLEHVRHTQEFQKEIRRVLRRGGRVIHVLPSSSWRFWTNLTYLVKYFRWPRVHGEHAAGPFNEIFKFSRSEWRKVFREAGWKVEAEHSNSLFYTGSSILDARLGINLRIRLSHLLGSSCNIFVLRTTTHNDDSSSQGNTRIQIS